jgi:DtxR family transcriptional regulator, Mn-dependent transcriptional regulator
MHAQISESSENYLETIFILDSEKKMVRVKEISQKMNVSMPSVHVALHLLEDQGFICHEHYGHVELTRKGRMTAQKIYGSHVQLVNFLTAVLGVSPDVAEQDACRIEHVISPQTLELMAKFSKNYSAAGERLPAVGGKA